MKKFVPFFFSSIFSLWSFFLQAQQADVSETDQTIDSLLLVLKSAKEDTINVNTLNTLSREYFNAGSYKEALQFANQALLQAEKLDFAKGLANAYSSLGNTKEKQGYYEQSLYYHLKSLAIKEKIGDRQGISGSYNNIGIVYNHQGNYEKALESYFKSLKIKKELGNKKGIANVYNNIGNIYLNQGRFENALDNYLKSLKIQEEIGDKRGTSASYGNIGLIYDKQSNYEKALDNYFKALKIQEQMGDKRGISISFDNIGIAYYKQINYEKSLVNHFKALKIRQEIGDKEGISISNIGIGNVYFSQGKYQKALGNYLTSLKISEEIGDKKGIANSFNSIGNIYLKQNKLEDSYNYLHRAIIKNKEINHKEGVRDSYAALFELYEKKGDFRQAFNYQKLYSDIKDTLLNEQSSKQIAEMDIKYESEKKEKDILLLTKDKKLQETEISKQKLIRNGSIGGLAIALSLAFILFNRFRVTSKQKKIIEFQNFQIVESINYSKKIQDSLLPSIESMQKAISNIFIFYEPKAIVSGDFYYFKQFEKYTLLACVDCTGHGVPGGFMSTLGSLLLDKIADSEALSPSEILNKLSNEIIRVLHQQNGGEIQDGMDLSICLIDRNNKKIEFSGARNGIIVVTNEQAKRYKADPLPVGGNYMKKGIAIERNFKTQHIPINANDWIYMYTDGFMEQVGGADGIPMNYSQFENQLLNVSKIESPEAKNKSLQMELDNWRGTHERDDDVLIMGFRVV